MRATNDPVDTARPRFLEIDGLKGLAALAILAYETLRFNGLPQGTPAALARVAADASQGFALFLLAAGFTLAYPILATLRVEGRASLDAGAYAVRRIARVYPAYAVVAAIALLLHPLAALFGYPALAHYAPATGPAAAARAALLDASGLGNDGLTAIGIFALAYLAFPFLLFVWTRAPRALPFLAVAAALLDALTRAHAIGIGFVVPLALGIAAADLRVANHRVQRFGLALAAIAAALAFALEGLTATLPGTALALAALRIDPFWSLAFFGVVAATGAFAPLRRACAFAGLRATNAVGYSITLVAMPIAAFAARELPPELNAQTTACITACVSLAAAFALRQIVDRRFASEETRRVLAAAVAPRLDAVLGRLRLARVAYVFPALAAAEPARPPQPEPIDDACDAPPAAAGGQAIISTRTGSPEELAAEIVETKRRLVEREAPSTILTATAAVAPETPRHAVESNVAAPAVPMAAEPLPVPAIEIAIDAAAHDGGAPDLRRRTEPAEAIAAPSDAAPAASLARPEPRDERAPAPEAPASEPRRPIRMRIGPERERIG